MDNEEREIKLFVRDLEALAERLLRMGAVLTHPRVFEQNFRLDLHDHHLKNHGKLLRLRLDDRARVTLKENPHFEGGVIARTEIEIVVDNFDRACALFEALGYTVVAIYEKYRREYRLGDALVMLDELPFGDFVEIEAESNHMIEAAARKLGLDWTCGIENNFLGLFEIVKSKLNLPFLDLTFTNFEDIRVTCDDLGVLPADV